MEIYDIDKSFIDEVIAKYVKNVNLIIENVEVFSDFAIVKLTIKKPNFDILEIDLKYEFEELKEEIKKEGLTENIIFQMGKKILKIFRTEEIYYIEEDMEVTLDKEFYEWKLSKFYNDEIASSSSEYEKFVELIEKLR